MPTRDEMATHAAIQRLPAQLGAALDVLGRIADALERLAPPLPDPVERLPHEGSR